MRTAVAHHRCYFADADRTCRSTILLSETSGRSAGRITGYSEKAPSSDLSGIGTINAVAFCETALPGITEAWPTSRDYLWSAPLSFSRSRRRKCASIQIVWSLMISTDSFGTDIMPDFILSNVWQSPTIFSSFPKRTILLSNTVNCSKAFPENPEVERNKPPLRLSLTTTRRKRWSNPAPTRLPEFQCFISTTYDAGQPPISHSRIRSFPPSLLASVSVTAKPKPSNISEITF